MESRSKVSSRSSLQRSEAVFTTKKPGNLAVRPPFWGKIRQYLRNLAGREESNARNSESVFLNPLPHLLARPGPFERMGVHPIILGPGLPHVINELGPTAPRSPLEVVVTECAEQQLRLIEPRGMDRSEATPPPARTARQVVLRLGSCMGRVVIVDQVDTAQVTMPLSERPQLPDVAISALRLKARRLHPSAVNDQEDQDVDRPVPGVIELAL